MKKAARLALILILTVCLLAGCEKDEAKVAGVFSADNEILTYERVDPEKTQLVVSRTGNINVYNLCGAFMEQNPDVQIIYIDITGGNSDYSPFFDWLAGGYVPDIMFNATLVLDDEFSGTYLQNLSQHPVISRFETEALQNTSFDGNIYALPGPSEINAIMYNKTLFEKYGWEVPATFDEFVALCDRIREDTNGEVEPWNPNAKYDGELRAALEAFCYAEVFGGVENRTWYDDYLMGETALAGHFEPYFDMVQTLVDHGLLREEHFTYSATERGKEFAAGKIAMINANIYNADNDEFDFGFMPYPATSGELGYICHHYSSYLSVPAKAHTDKETDAINRFLDFYSSADGQAAFIGTSLMISNVKFVQVSADGDLLSLQSALDAGHMFSTSGIGLYQYVKAMTAGEMTGGECIAESDARRVAGEAVVQRDPPEVIANVPEEMTMLETSFYIADFYRETAGADIGLIAHGVPYRGNLMKFFPGELTAGMVAVFKPRSFANGSTLIKVSMTGAQLMDALNDPLGKDPSTNCVYAYSGLKCELAPTRALGGKYVSVALADGSAIEPEKVYTVAVWEGTVKDEYITGVLETYEGSWEQLMTGRIAADGIVVHADDGRVKLIWD